MCSTSLSPPFSDHLACMHASLLAGQPSSEPQIQLQLDELEKATAAFRAHTLDNQDEVVGFQVLAGDLGFTNAQDKLITQHPLLTQ